MGKWVFGSSDQVQQTGCTDSEENQKLVEISDITRREIVLTRALIIVLTRALISCAENARNKQKYLNKFLQLWHAQSTLKPTSNIRSRESGGLVVGRPTLNQEIVCSKLARVPSCVLSKTHLLPQVLAPRL